MDTINCTKQIRNPKEKVLFLCNHNSARSQMAEGLLKSLYGEYYDVYSAGNDPNTLNSYAVDVMAEIGIDISEYRSKSLKEFEGSNFDYVATACSGSGDTCPFFLGGKNYLHKPVEDPSAFEGSKEERIKFFRKIRDEIKVWIESTFKK
jgi:arsenate reductase (thioredoxin)